jgi:polysaccharide biosynthesis transport protein
MNGVEFLRLISRHKIFLLAMPTAMVILVFLLTANSPQIYSSKATIYTGITSGYSIDAQDNGRVDFYRANAAYDNMLNLVKSRSTQEEVSIRLLAQHLSMKSPKYDIISDAAFRHLMELVPPDVRKLASEDYNSTLINLKKARSEDRNSFLYGVFNYSTKYYSLSDLSNVLVKRLNNSDIIELTYETDDAGICKNTLLFYTQVVAEEYRSIKEAQSNEVYKYFEKQLAAVEEKLNTSEDRLQAFNVDNDIINYYEQTKFVADRHEKMDAEYNQEKMLFSAADSAMKKLEVNMNIRQKLIIKNTEILEKRNILADLNFKLSMIESSDTGLSQNKHYTELAQQANSVKNELVREITALASLNFSDEGLTSNELLMKWLDNMIKYEEGKARLIIMEQYRQNFLKRYKLFAPLGAEMKRIERKINVHEQEYLSVLYGLNLSKLKQQSLEMASNLKTVDAPYLPIKPLASKRKFVVVSSGLVGFLIALSLVFFTAYLDNTVKTPENASNVTGLEVAGMLVRGTKNAALNSVINTRLSHLLMKKILMLKEKNNNQGPLIISILSSKHGDGKTFVAHKLVEHFKQFNFNPLLITLHEQAAQTLPAGIDQVTYPSGVDLLKTHSLAGMIRDNLWNTGSRDFIVIEIPAILDDSFPLQHLKEPDISLLVCKSTRSWNSADVKALELIREAGAKNMFLVLNGIEPVVSESFLGEIEKKRSFIRRKLKQILLFEFNSEFKKS